jgi:molecular chaperone Hsp33
MSEIVKALAHQGRIRVIVANTTELVETARKIHDTYPTASAAFGRLLGITAVMGSMLKNKEDQITCSIRGDGPLIKIMAVSTSDGRTKGYVVEPHVHLINSKTQKLDVGKAVGSGTLEIIKDMGLKSNFTSTIDLVTGEIGEDFAQYFTISEQTPSAVSLGVLVGENNEVISAGALLIQMMPDATEEDILAAEHVIKYLKPISTIFHEGQSSEEVVKSLFGDVEILEVKQIEYVCNCSKERTKNALRLIDPIDLNDMIHEDEQAEIVCQFCKKQYVFDKEELKEILKEKIAFDEHKKHKS